MEPNKEFIKRVRLAISQDPFLGNGDLSEALSRLEKADKRSRVSEKAILKIYRGREMKIEACCDKMRTTISNCDGWLSYPNFYIKFPISVERTESGQFENTCPFCGAPIEISVKGEEGKK